MSSPPWNYDWEKSPVTYKKRTIIQGPEEVKPTGPQQRQRRNCHAAGLHLPGTPTDSSLSPRGAPSGRRPCREQALGPRSLALSTREHSSEGLEAAVWGRQNSDGVGPASGCRAQPGGDHWLVHESSVLIQCVFQVFLQEARDRFPQLLDFWLLYIRSGFAQTGFTDLFSQQALSSITKQRNLQLSRVPSVGGH